METVEWIITRQQQLKAALEQKKMEAAQIEGALLDYDYMLQELVKPKLEITPEEPAEEDA